MFSAKIVFCQNCFLLGYFRYAYAGETEDDYDEEAISLTSGVRIMTGVRVIGDSGTTLERKEKKGSALTELVSDKREDPEEDKRE